MGSQRKVLIKRQEIAYKAPSGGLERTFWDQNRHSKRTNAARQPPFSARLCLAHHFGLSVLDYMVTCNHVHLLIKDTGPKRYCRQYAVDC